MSFQKEKVTQANKECYNVKKARLTKKRGPIKAKELCLKSSAVSEFHAHPFLLVNKLYFHLNIVSMICYDATPINVTTTLW